MSPLNRGPLLGPRVPPAGIRPPPPPRFGGRLPPPGLPPRMPPPPMSPVFGPMRQRLPPPPRPGGVNRPSGPMPLFGPRGVRGMAPMVPLMGLRGAGPRGPLIRPWPRRGLPPQIMSRMRPRFLVGNGNAKGKAINNVKKVNKLEELELKKPWMTDEIRSEIQKKNKLYAKAKKNKDAKEWEEFKDLRNKVTRMIRDAKNDYFAKHPEQGGQKTGDKNTNESEGVQKTENATEQSEQMELTEEMQPSSEQAHLYPDDEEPYDQRDENYTSSEDEESFYCEVCDREFPSEDSLSEHNKEHKLCGIDGCTFSAHPLLVEKHITMQHSTGLYNKIKNISTPEDIQKWITERKKKYPTKTNVELRKAEELEKIQRGEIIKEKQDVTHQRKKKQVRPRNKKRTSKKFSNLTFNDIPETKQVYRGVKEFSGTLNLRDVEVEKKCELNNEVVESEQEGNINYISDEEETPAILSNVVTASPCIPNLVANYGSDSEESDGPEEVPIKRIKFDNDIQVEVNEKKMENDVVENDVTNNTNQYIQKSNQELVTGSVSTSTNTKHKHKANIEQARCLKDKYQKKPVNNIRTYRSQLLEKLLSRSIQHERNLICQCIKYIVDNNFFD